MPPGPAIVRDSAKEAACQIATERLQNGKHPY